MFFRARLLLIVRYNCQSMKKKQMFIEKVKLEKFVHGGQCLGMLGNGIKIFVWGGLPGETVSVDLTYRKKSYLEGIVRDVIVPSSERIEPIEPEIYLSSSPWQIMNFESENKAKQAILEETFAREHVEDIKWGEFISGKQEFGYRNKIELGFWGDDDGLNYASYVRGTHGKKIVKSNALAMDRINSVLDSFLESVRDFARKKSLRAGDLKTVLFRASQDGSVVASLFLKQDIDVSDFSVPKGLKGLSIYFSNPKSPASLPTKLLYSFGDITLMDTILDKNISYDVLSFFQVNVPVFEQALRSIDEATKGCAKIDMYSGVGTIGIPISGTSTLVESDENNVRMAEQNVGTLPIKVVYAPSETALEYIDDTHALIVDPPRAGLHRAVVDRIIEAKPPMVVYLSCNPSTQARDVKLLSDSYKIRSAQGFNFFPRTPHIESLLVLERL